MREVEVIVVGAGPAGSTAARTIAAGGHEVLLLDRARFPRDKPCGGGVTIRTAALLPFSLEPVIEDVIYGARLRLRDGREVIRDSDTPLTYMTQRRRLDHFLVEQAQQSGAEFRDGVQVRHVRQKTGDLFEVHAGDERYRARVVIGADGANGTVATSLGYEHAEESAVALEGNIPFAGGVPEEFRRRVALNFGYLAGGYGWIFPKGDHVNVGVGGWASSGKRLRPALRRLCEVYGLDVASVQSLRGHHLPMQRAGMSVAGRGSAVIGDAAGMVDPLSGEGIYAAVVSGAAVARAADDYLAGRAPSLAGYQREVACTLAPELRASKALMEIFHAAPEPLVWAFQHSGLVWRRACALVQGETGYDALAHTFGRLGTRTLLPAARIARWKSGHRPGAC